jgi:hypothetical protein
VSGADGSYELTEIAPRDYRTQLVVPLGYQAANQTMDVTVWSGQPTGVSYPLTCVASSGDIRGVGFWLHQFGVAITGNGQAHVDTETLCAHLDEIVAHFNGNAVNPVTVYIHPAGASCTDKLILAKGIIKMRGNTDAQTRAKRHLFTLLLNVISGRINPSDVVSLDGATLSQAITHSNALIVDPVGDAQLAAHHRRVLGVHQLRPGSIEWRVHLRKVVLMFGVDVIRPLATRPSH